MARIRVSVLGPIKVEVDGRAVKLSPRALRVLTRLVAAEGRPVGVKQLRWDLWQEADRAHQARNGRNQVQKAVFELRQALDPERAAGVGTEVLLTDRQPSGREVETTYRLVLDADSCDAFEFAALVSAALHDTAASAADRLTRAIALWRGLPLAGAGDAEYARDLINAWQARYRRALRELIRIHCDLGRLDLALAVASRAVAEFPDDADAAADLADVDGRLRAHQGGQILRQDFADLRTSVVIVRGDLLAQDDAHLVIGFTDTFDVETKQNLVINRNSMQGQLLERLYGGDAAALDRALRRGLRSVRPVERETVRTKPSGKRLRYPIGTVVTLPLDDRRIFAAAYSRLDKDLRAKARREDLEAALDQVWAAAALSGQLAPVAVPLVGSGLSRVVGLGPEQLIGMIVESFLRGCREHVTVTRQLRIVLRPGDLERTDMAQVSRSIAALAR